MTPVGMLLAVLLLTGCASTGVIDKQATQSDTKKPVATAEIDPGARREHERILAAYNGAYEDCLLYTSPSPRD